MSSHGFVGDLLIRAGVVDADGLARGVEAQSRNGTTLGRSLASLGLAEESAVSAAIASAMHLEYLEDATPEIAATVVALLPQAFCQKRGAAPLGFDGNILRVAAANPLGQYALYVIAYLARSGMPYQVVC